MHVAAFMRLFVSTRTVRRNAQNRRLVNITDFSEEESIIKSTCDRVTTHKQNNYSAQQQTMLN